jgi:hypothetical protein
MYGGRAVFWLTMVTFGSHFGCTSSDVSSEASASASWRVDSIPELQVGGHDNRPEYTLYNVAAVTRLSDGRVVVANSGTSQLRFYSRDGTHLYDVGGEGVGPGELRFIFDLVRASADSLIVFSRDPGLTWYDPSGRYVRSERRDMFGVPNHPCRFGEGGNWKLMSDGTLLRLLVDNFAPEYCPDRPEGPFRWTGLLGIPSADGSSFDTITIMPATERVGINYRVFGHDLLVALASDRIYAGDTESESILALSLDGDTLAALPTPFAARPVPERLKDEDLREVRQRDGTTRFVPGFSHYPDLFPRYARLLVDSEGHLWVMQYPIPVEAFNSWQLALPFGNVVPEGGAFWRVLDTTGLVVAEVVTPEGFFPMEIGSDYVLGISRNELDVQTVHQYRLRR